MFKPKSVFTLYQKFKIFQNKTTQLDVFRNLFQEVGSKLINKILK